MEQRIEHMSHRFDKDAALAVRSGCGTGKLRSVIELLSTHQPVPSEFKDQPPKGDWKGYRNLHIEADWLLIYKRDEGNLWLVRTVSHADLFG